MARGLRMGFAYGLRRLLAPVGGPVPLRHAAPRAYRGLSALAPLSVARRAGFGQNRPGFLATASTRPATSCENEPERMSVHEEVVNSTIEIHLCRETGIAST